MGLEAASSHWSFRQDLPRLRDLYLVCSFCSVPPACSLSVSTLKCLKATCYTAPSLYRKVISVEARWWDRKAEHLGKLACLLCESKFVKSFGSNMFQLLREETQNKTQAQSCQACADTGFPHSSPIREVLFGRTPAYMLTSRTKEPTSKAGNRPIISF